MCTHDIPLLFMACYSHDIYIHTHFSLAACQTENQDRALGLDASHPGKQIAKEMDIATFQATKGWLRRFPKRHGFEHLQPHGEAGDISKAAVAKEIVDRTRKQLTSVDPELILNMDVLSLFSEEDLREP